MLMNPTTGAALEEAACAHFLPYLTSTEDFDSFETSVAGGMRSFAAKCVARSVEAFDASLREHVPRGWALHEVAERTIVTMVGEVTYRRSVYLDRCGRRRTWADELLGIPKRSRLSACAFLWVVRHAAELSYRKTADEFERETGARISHVAVMNCVREEGRLLKSAPPAGGGISSEAAFVEVDGLWIHLQGHAHRGEALPRQLYEQARRTQSFELKMACCYCGKREVSPGRLERGNLSVTVADEEPDAFWERVAVQLGADYELSDVRELWVGHDGAAWCSADRVAASVPEGVAVAGSLDPFHVLKYVDRAFPEGKSRDWATSLAYRGKGKRLSEMASRIAACMPPGKRRDKVERLASYAAANAAAYASPGPRWARWRAPTSTSAPCAARTTRRRGQGRAPRRCAWSGQRCSREGRSSRPTRGSCSPSARRAPSGPFWGSSARRASPRRAGAGARQRSTASARCPRSVWHAARDIIRGAEMTAMVTGPVVGIHGVYPDKLNSHILNGTKVRQNCSDNRNSNETQGC